MRPLRGTAGFSSIEVVIGLLVTGLLLSAAWDLWQTISDEERSLWTEANRRSADHVLERALGGALASAGQGLRSSANLSGVHVAAGASSDTLYVLQAAGPPARVAARSCRIGAPAECVALLGDHRSSFAPGMVVLLGTEGTGLAALQVTEAPVAFSAPCGADCIERLLCAFAAAAGMNAPDVAGSVTTPPGGAPIPSVEPCPQPVLADGSRCTENETAVAVAAAAPDPCVTSGPASTYTEVRLAELGSRWGLPAPSAAPARRAGAGGTPGPTLQPVAVSRFWARGSDSTLVRETAPGTTGGWGRTQRVTAPILSLRVETLHAGQTAWTAGTGVTEASLQHVPPFLTRAAGSADEGPRAWYFGHGYHTIAAVRVTYETLRDGPNGTAVRETRRLVEPTPGIRTGALTEGAAP